MGGIGSGTYKPRRAKCHECGNGMIKKAAPQKYHASCAEIVKKRYAYEYQVRTGLIENPGIGRAKPMLRGEGHPNFAGSVSWQAKTFRGKECERCGTDKGKMHLHHRDRDTSNWKKKNLETLCVPCHIKEHRGEVHAAA